MNGKLILRGSAALMACVSLSACLGNGGGIAAGGRPGGGGNYSTELNRVQQLGPQTQRQTGTVNYSGQTRLETTLPGASAANGFFVGDVALAANFDAGTLSGTATNFEGEVDGQAVTLAGTLDSANTTDPNIVTQSDTPVPIIGSITQGNLIGALRGTLTESVNNESSTAQLVLTGAFVGTNATAATGTAAMLVGDEAAVGFGIGGAGTFYVDRD